MPVPTGGAPVGPFPPDIDPSDEGALDAYDRRRRRVLWSFPTGLYVVGSRHGEERNLMTCSLLAQLATTPKLVGVSIETGAVTHRLIAAGGGFTVSLVAREQRALVRKFVKPATWDAANVTLNDVPVAEAPVSGIPVLTGAQSGSPAAVDCRVVAQHDLGSHSLFVGEVVDVLGDVNEEFEILRMEDTKMSYGG